MKIKGWWGRQRASVQVAVVTVVLGGIVTGSFGIISAEINKPAASQVAGPSGVVPPASPATAIATSPGLSPSPTQSNSPVATPSAVPPYIPPTAGAPPVRNQGELTLPGDRLTSYDLDSTDSDWGKGSGGWVMQDIQYYPNGNGGDDLPTLAIANAPENDVLMVGPAHWTYQDCRKATYIQSYAASQNPNSPQGAAISPGRFICVWTGDTPNNPAKTDGGHYALLQVLARTSAAITLEITVWQ